MAKKIIYTKNDYGLLSSCPWCESSSYTKWGRVLNGFKTAQCSDCGLIFVINRLNQSGLKKCYGDYLNQVHRACDNLNKRREIMYALEGEFINPYLVRGMKVLDVGCSGGYFLDYFKRKGCACYGVEFGEAAAREASGKYIVWQGELPTLSIDKKFDLIIFRGVVQYFLYPKLYLNKAVSLLNKNGLIYITSTPNSSSFCCKLFKEKWNQHIPEHHLMHFHTGHFDNYFLNLGFKRINQYFFYEETPYADISNDILQVSRAIALKKRGERIPFCSPAFWNNMMSLIYQKPQA